MERIEEYTTLGPQRPHFENTLNIPHGRFSGRIGETTGQFLKTAEGIFRLDATGIQREKFSNWPDVAEYIHLHP